MSYGVYESFYEPHVSGFKSNGRQAYGRCPFHEDTNASFSVNLLTGQFRCHGCQLVGNAITFARKFGVSTPSVDGSIAPSLPAPAHTSRPQQPVRAPLEAAGGTNEPRAPISLVATYEYQYEDGAPATRVLRYEPKSFRQQRWNGQAWIWSLEGVRRVPYRLPKLLASKDLIHWVEGEKDVETLERHGLLATTTPMGAKSWAADYARYFNGRFIALLPDNDPPGEAYARAAAADLRAAGAHVKLVRLPGLPEKGDVSDYLSGVGTIEELRLAVKHAPIFAEIKHLDMDPMLYFRERGIEPYPAGSYMPSEFKSLCSSTYKAFARLATRATEAVFERLEEAERVWRTCTSKLEYERFVRLLKEAHELSRVEQ